MTQSGTFSAALLAFVAGFAIASGAWAKPLPAGPDLDRGGWRTHSFSGIPPTQFTGLEDGAIRLTADRASGLLYRKLNEDLEGFRSLAWSWRVDHPTPATDLTQKGQDDRPLALHMWFPDPDDGGLFSSIGSFLVEDIVGAPHSGLILTYVWGGTQTPGTYFANPHVEGKGVMIVLRDGHTETGRWYQEKIDFAADFERIFGRPAAAPTFIALSADSDDTGTRCESQIRDLRFLPE